MKYIPEPFKIKMVEPIRLTTAQERREKIAAANYNNFGLHADDVYIDLLTDSGTNAMSNAQWSAMLTGDEAYSGGRSYYDLIGVAQEIFGYEWIQPVHQGRAAEKVLFPVLIGRPGQVVISNTFFDTTRAHVALANGRPIDCVCPEGLDSGLDAPFKGNMDNARLETLIAEHGDEVAGIVVTITNNSVGGQPVSMANMRETARIAAAHGIPLVIDAARFAENAYFIKAREAEFADATIAEIIREFFSYGDIFTMSAKKDAITNMGGLLGVREEGEHVPDVRSLVIAGEGYVTYGGLSGRDLAALAVGLREGMDEDYLRYRTGQVAYLAARLDEFGIPYQRPAGGHAVFVDAGKLLPHLPWHQYPGHALAVELYIEAGVRTCDIGSYLMDRDPATGQEQQAPLEFTRLAIPRRVYTQAHLDVIAEALGAIKERAGSVPGYEITWEPKVLRHFTATLRPLS
ncbi:tryptophanase [Kineosphaera limosa]|uniref:Tryptophanase n=1 Tax=Kineosphaera limosa NBRC 100340 TaxID=1184609 RepID=K6WR59_9MICO|nr:tryptophanase [Kineosphaera limosa]NYD99248.1 tryptophanase [Kineosphaera limosa]GAB96286.1 tryptophanase [Kineosphaera limosa NBRC 100340]